MPTAPPVVFRNDAPDVTSARYLQTFGTTRGPSDKKIKTSAADTDAFDESLGITSTDLERLVKKLADLEKAALDAEKTGGSK